MKHRIKQRLLQRGTSHRLALLANLAASLIEHEQITTTLPKAKELKPFVDKLITLGKKGDVASRRLAVSRIRNEEVVKKLFDVVAPRYKSRSGGYTRIMKFGHRFGDAADKAIVELVDRDTAAKGKKDVARVAAERAAEAEAQA
jgi:large subunit ribosomal protein L17